MSANSPNNSESPDEPETITDLSELAFDFEEATPSNRPPVYGSATEDRTAGELAEELELLDSLAGQITGDGPPEFYCKPLGQLLGPMSLAELRIMAESGALSEGDLVRYGENGDWKPAGSFARLAESLHRGSAITAEPVSSAPPSTRRLFQTGYKPTGDSFGEDTSGSGVSSSSSTEQGAQANQQAETATAPPVPAAEAEVGGKEPETSSGRTMQEESASADNTNVKSESETSAGADPRRKKAAKKSAPTKRTGKKSAGKKKPAKKRNDEDDAILNEIFSEVFAEDQKSQRAAMPPAAGASLSKSEAAAAASPSAANDASAKPPATT